MATSQAGTPQAFIESLQAPNFLENTSIQKALKFNVYLTGLGLAFDSIVAIQGSPGTDAAQEFPLATLTAAGISQDVVLYLFGVNGSEYHNIALEIQLIAGVDPINSYIKLYDDRNPGSTIGQAMGALFQLPTVHDPVVKALGKLKADTGIF